MKEIKAYIKTFKLSKVSQALQGFEGLAGMTVVDVRGFGRGGAKTAPDKVTGSLVNYMSLVKLELVCDDELVEQIVSIIEQSAHTGLRGDGKIYVSSIEQAIRISTGERGDAAV